MQIYKYKLDITDEQTISMPVNARILCVQPQDGDPHLWVEVAASTPVEDRTFMIVGTGHFFNTVRRMYIGTAQCSRGLVWHVYETTK